jgi:uncharacterized membrane protein
MPSSYAKPDATFHYTEMDDPEVEQLVSLTLAGASFVLFTQLATRTDLPGMLSIAWYILAVCIPVLCAFALEPFPDTPGGEKLDHFMVYVYFATFTVDAVAVAFVFEYLRRGAGLVFILSSLAAYWYLRRCVRSRKQRQK